MTVKPMIESPTPDASGPSAAKLRQGRLTLLLIAAAALAPIVAAYAFYYFFPRSAAINYGALLSTAPAPLVEGKRADGSPFRLDELRGRWVLLAGSPAGCDARCVQKLYATRQARTMQGREQERVVRAWFVVGDDPPPPGLLAQHPGLLVVDVAKTAMDGFPGGPESIYLLDPLGNLVLRYPENPDIKGLAKDLSRLLTASQIG